MVWMDEGDECRSEVDEAIFDGNFGVAILGIWLCTAIVNSRARNWIAF